MLTICTWLWGDKFGPDDVAKLFAGIRRNLRQSARFIVVADKNLEIKGVECIPIPIGDLSLTKIKGCFSRLRMFDQQWQHEHKIEGRLVDIDLDTVITGPLDLLFDRPEPFVIMQGGNASNPCPYNGALMMLRAGAHPEVWQDFSVEVAGKVPFFEFPDDQGWLWHKVPNAAGWKCGVESGVFVFHKPGWPGWKNRKNATPNDELPQGARLVTFSGWRNPKRFEDLGWVKENWRI